MEKKYYEAYEERYRTVHDKGIRWSSDTNSPIVMDIIKKYNITPQHHLLEVGCGEGRDSRTVLERGFNLMATDISNEAIKYCKRIMPNYESNFSVLDCLSDDLDKRFDFIYGIAVIHMLVLDNDRDGFYQFISNHLKTDMESRLFVQWVMEKLKCRVILAKLLIFRKESMKLEK